MKIIPLSKEKRSSCFNHNLKNKSTNFNQYQKNEYKYTETPILSILNFTGNVELQEKDDIDTKNLSDFLDRYYITTLKIGKMPNSILSICRDDLFNQKFFRQFSRKNNLKYKEVISRISLQTNSKYEYYDRIIQEAQKSKQEGEKTILGIDFNLIPLENGKIPQKYNDFFMNCAKEYNCSAFVHSDSIYNIEKDTTLPFDIAIFLDSNTNKKQINEFMKFKDGIPIFTASTSKLARVNKKFNNLLSNLPENCSGNEKELLSDNQSCIGNAMAILSDFSLSTSELDSSAIKKIAVSNVPLVDYWLSLSGYNASKYPDGLKNEWLELVLQDKERTSSLISQTLDKLQEENSLINDAREAYKKIIEKENYITPDQKEILVKQQDSKLFFQVISNNLNPNNYDVSIKLQVNTLEALKQLSKEKEDAKNNARQNLFNPARTIDLENEESNEIINFIFDMLNKKALISSQKEKNELKSLIEDFEQAKDTGNWDNFNSIWQEMIDIAQDYFENQTLDELTDRNIELLNSINKNIKNETNPHILNLINSPSLTIEQREFVSRYKDDINFKRLLVNPNIDVESIIEELVYFEAGNRDLIDNNNLDISYKKIMSDKFHEIDSNAKDINIQGNKISNKLDKINSTIKEQNGLISDFADNFAAYADTSLAIQSNQLEELVSINQNTFEIKAYTRALTRTKLVELERDKYYKDIVPEITKLLPENEQIDLKDFLAKVDELAKHEKDDKRKKKLIKAGLIIAGTIAAGALVYYAGPTVVAHLASKLPAQAALKAATSTATKVGLARSVGNSALIKQISFGHYSSDPLVLQNEIDKLKREIKFAIEMAKKGGSDASYWTNKVSELTKELTQHQKWLAEALKKIKSSI